MGTDAHDDGFTLLELLVVMALLSLAATTALLSMPGLSDRLAIERSAQEIQRELLIVAANASDTGFDRVVTVETARDSTTLQINHRRIELDPTFEVRWEAAKEAGSNVETAAIVFFGIGGSSGGALHIRRGKFRSTVNVDWLTARVTRSD